MAFPLSFLREPLIYKRNFPFPIHLAIVAIKEPQDIWIDFKLIKLKWQCLSTAKLSVPPKIKFRVHSNLKYMFQKVFQMAGVKLTISRLLLKGIYWYQSANRRFIYSHLFIHSQSHKGRAYSSCFIHVIVERMRLPFFKIFSNFGYFWSNFQKFCPFSQNLHARPYWFDHSSYGRTTCMKMY